MKRIEKPRMDYNLCIGRTPQPSKESQEAMKKALAALKGGK